MLMHVQMPEESVPESALTEQEYRTRLWEAFMANVERGDDAANDVLVQAHAQLVRAQSAATQVVASWNALGRAH